MPAILLITYAHEADPDEWAAGYTAERALPFLDVPGLTWKIWLDDASRKRSGAVFLFEDRAAAEAYLATPRGSRQKNNPDLKDLRVEVFDIREAMTKITRGPIGPAS